MKNKRTILWLAVIVTAIIPACTKKHDVEKDYKARPINGGKGVEITAYVGEKWQVRIPSRIQNIPVTHIGERAFQKKELISVTIPSSVTSIGEGAFANTGLTSVSIPKSVTSIGEGAFAGCDDLTAINVASGNTTYSSDRGGVLYNKDKTALIHYPRGKKDSTFIIPDSVTSIGNGIFQSCHNLTSITIGNGVTIIGDFAFASCINLAGITIPDSVTDIGEHSFELCKGLTSVTIGNGVTSIGRLAFCRTGLTSVTIPDSVTHIRYGAFMECANITSVTIGSGVTNIGEGIFYDCKNLTSVTFQSSIASAGFGYNSPFPGDLRAKYFAMGVGTYTRPSGDSYTWTKQ